ncbi:MAG: LuxR C-terminal-related transcriptional regulator [Pedococcus sp.]
MARAKSATKGLGSLPAEMTSFVGRRREITETRRLLSSSRLLTLTGMGGVGKTRLAVRMAADLRRTFADGVWFVELASLHDPQLLPHTVANTLELRQVSANPAADLADYLEDKRLLVVLDNCEHLTDACAVLISKLLAAAPGLQVLATSRHVLGVEGEQILPVPPLSAPEEDEDGTGDPRRYESVALFLDRATAVAPDFLLVDANSAAVLELCRRLDGIPLAIELAAVWLRTLTPVQILERLEDRFALLASGRNAAPARQRALDAAIGWSFDLCSPAERLLWARLSVFVGGFDLEAAEDVCSGNGIVRRDVLGLIAGLVTKSIITRQNATSHAISRYQMLETIRQYGAAQLVESGEAQDVHRRHRDHYRSLAQQFGRESFSARQAEWFLRLRREHGNVRAAIDLCLQTPGESPVALDIAAPMWNFWFAGFLREGHRYLIRALERATAPDLRRAYGLWAASYLSMFAGEFDRTHTMLAECSGLAEQFDDELLRARIDECRGHASMYQGDLTGACALLESGLSRFRAVGDPLGEFDTLILLSAAAFFLDDPRTEDFSEQALALAVRHGALSSKAYALWSVGIVRWQQGRIDEARRALRESIRLFQPMHDLTGLSFDVQALSWCAALEAPDERAARLLGASRAVWRASGAKVDETTAYGLFDQRSEEAVRRALGDTVFEAAFAEGAASSLDQALSLAIGEVEGSDEEAGAGEPTPAAEVGTAEVLTRREQEIAVLIAQGLSNREIAARLVISSRTAETHVGNILNKLGLTSRAQVASRMARDWPH